MSAFKTPAPPLSRGWWLLAVCILGGALLGNLCVVHNPFLWFDEASQFFVSMGIHLTDPPGTDPKYLADVLARNNEFLFDPIGYTLLLRAWLNVSTVAPWMRLLSFLGFCGLFISGYRFLRLAGVRGPIALLLLALLPSSPLLYQYAGEIRPYIFEAWGAVFCGCVLLRYGRTKGLRYPLLAGLGMSAFLWARYPFVIACGITGLLLLVQLLVTKPAGGTKRFALYVLPQAVSAIAIYLLCIRHQPITPQMPDYGMATTLRYNPAFLLHPWTMIYHLLVIGFLGATLFAKKLFPASNLRLGRWAFFVFFLFLIWSFFAATGKISSDPNTRWGIELNVVAMLCGGLLAALILERIPVRFLPAGLLFISVVALYRPAVQTYRWSQGDAVRFKGEYFVEKLSRIAQTYPGEIWSPFFSTPEVKYLFEWGSLRPIRDKVLYPEHFVLLNVNNRMDGILKMPIKEPRLWINFPDNHNSQNYYKVEPVENTKGMFSWVWRLK